jgi:tripartite-type tricarboxylate transporter receptor subunit TctC
MIQKHNMLQQTARAAVLATLTVVGTLAVAADTTKDYPTRPIRIIATTTPGSGPDIMARLYAQKITEEWRQAVVVDNRAGASGRIGTQIAANATPDGYSLLLLTSSNVIVATLFAGTIKYDLQRDFAPISLLGSTPFILTANRSVPMNSITELIAYAKANPGKLRYGSGGAGTPPHLSAERLKVMAGIDILHVPFRGIAPALNDTVSGEVHLTFAVIPAVLAFLKSKRLKALGVTGLKRSPLVPDLPTIAETIPGYEAMGWYSLVVPTGTPPAIVAKLNAVSRKIAAMPDIRARISALGAESTGSTPKELADYMAAEKQKLQQLIKAAKLRTE